MPESTGGALTPLARATARVRTLLLALALLVVVSSLLIGLALGAGGIAIGLAIGTSLLVLLVQWIVLERAGAAGASPVPWLALSYLSKIAIIALGLYVPDALGVPIRFPALVLLATVLLAMLLEVAVLARSRIPAVDAPEDRARLS